MPERGGTTGGDGVVALAGVEGTVGGDACDLLVGRDLVEKRGQHGRVAHIAGGELSGTDFECFLINSDVDPAPDASFRAAMFTGVPLSFALDLDAPRRFARTGGAYRLDVDQQVQGPL